MLKTIEEERKEKPSKPFSIPPLLGRQVGPHQNWDSGMILSAIWGQKVKKIMDKIKDIFP